MSAEAGSTCIVAVACIVERLTVLTLFIGATIVAWVLCACVAVSKAGGRQAVVITRLAYATALAAVAALRPREKAAACCQVGLMPHTLDS